MSQTQGQWFYERAYHQLWAQGVRYQKVLHSEKSAFQEITVLQTEALGRLLLLDNKTMVSDHDEFIYHEVMAHIPSAVLKNHQNALVIGGGDGGVIRELVKHPEWKKIQLVEIDQRVIDVSREYFPNCTSGLDDPRVEVHAQDGFEFLKNTTLKYDLIVVDSTDPENFAKNLFTGQFYQMIQNSLTEVGIMMNQTENPLLDEYGIGQIYQNMRQAFNQVHSFSAPMLIYPGVFWTFGFCSQKSQPLQLNPTKEKFLQDPKLNLKWYNPNWHRGAFQLSNLHLKAIGQKS